ncbi:hypothetical protein MtrunA17_Chr7g0236301 [Medicago truncatula]|uniref:Uncharacterized protein n=1 Tax=Medicago truncatula TaxID=3880 RepID=A0A396H2E4_MEDTR|nr:hypothetical protein MtrunA17_Chr7g0236301 [Medicago truncatula]
MKAETRFWYIRSDQIHLRAMDSSTDDPFLMLSYSYAVVYV